MSGSSDHDHDEHGEHDEDEYVPPHPNSHEGGDHSEPWLVSYADMMTLLFGFFVIMYSFAVAKLDDDPNMIKIRKELASYFGGQYIDPIANMDESIKRYIDNHPDLKKSIEVTSDPEGLRIVITSQLLFKSGEATLAPDTQPLIEKIVQSISNQGKNFGVRVEGYTDDVPIRSSSFDSNWELSAARAITVLRVFEAHGFEPSRLQATGFGEGHPLAPNHNANGLSIPENQAKNRRVVIRALMDQKESAVAPNHDLKTK